MTSSVPTPSSPAAPFEDGGRWQLPGLSIVLPCFNEEAGIADAIGAASRAAARYAPHFEIVVVDDGSTDATAKVTDRLRDLNPHVRLVVNSSNRGYGAAVRSGIEAAAMPWILLTDATLQFDLDKLEDFVPHTRSADLVVGWRVMRSDPFRRRINAAVWNWLIRRHYCLPVRDVDCAFKLVRRDLAAGQELTSDGAMINAELLARCLAAGGRLIEVPIRHRPRVSGGPSGADVGVLARAFRELFRLHRKLPRLSGNATV
jgi:glycosyltransferase involved in cell wall biosynthesis